MKKIVLTFGIIAGVILSLLMILTFLLQDRLGFEHGMVIGYTTMVASLLMVYFGIRSYRDTVLGGHIRFWPAMKVGLLISLVATCFYVATWEIMYYNFMPNYMHDYTVHELEKAKAAGATAEQLAKQRAAFDEFEKQYQNPLVSSAYTFLEPLPIVLLMTLISAGLLSRSRRSEVSTDGVPAS